MNTESRRRDARYGISLAVLGVVAAAAAVTIHGWLFPLYSLNRDDSVYVAMARLLEHGHATLPVDQVAFRPWASAVRGDHIVLKYSPPWPAALAAADLLTGATWTALGVTAAAAAVLTVLLVDEVLADRTVGLIAGVLLVLSPMFLVQSGTYLPYVFQLALGLGSAVLLLRGTRRRATVAVVAAGAVIGVAAWARPYDAFLMTAPFVCFVVLHAWSRRHTTDDLWPWWGVLLRLGYRRGARRRRLVALQHRGHGGSAAASVHRDGAAGRIGFRTTRGVPRVHVAVHGQERGRRATGQPALVTELDRRRDRARGAGRGGAHRR